MLSWRLKIVNIKRVYRFKIQAKLHMNPTYKKMRGKIVIKTPFRLIQRTYNKKPLKICKDLALIPVFKPKCLYRDKTLIDRNEYKEDILAE